MRFCQFSVAIERTKTDCGLRVFAAFSPLLLPPRRTTLPPTLPTLTRPTLPTTRTRR